MITKIRTGIQRSSRARQEYTTTMLCNINIHRRQVLKNSNKIMRKIGKKQAEQMNKVHLDDDDSSLHLLPRSQPETTLYATIKGMHIEGKCSENQENQAHKQTEQMNRSSGR